MRLRSSCSCALDLPESGVPVGPGLKRLARWGWRADTMHVAGLVRECNIWAWISLTAHPFTSATIDLIQIRMFSVGFDVTHTGQSNPGY
jgi:hypothetical protein